MSPRDSRILEFVLLSSLTYTQIWVIPLVADRHGGTSQNCHKKNSVPSLPEVSYNKKVFNIQHVAPVSESETTRGIIPRSPGSR
jgi:hypothetical protein